MSVNTTIQLPEKNISIRNVKVKTDINQVVKILKSASDGQDK